MKHPKEFYDERMAYAEAHNMSLVDAIRLYYRENNIKEETVPADTEKVLELVRKIAEEDKELLEALRKLP